MSAAAVVIGALKVERSADDTFCFLISHNVKLKKKKKKKKITRYSLSICMVQPAFLTSDHKAPGSNPLKAELSSWLCRNFRYYIWISWYNVKIVVRSIKHQIVIKFICIVSWGDESEDVPSYFLRNNSSPD